MQGLNYLIFKNELIHCKQAKGEGGSYLIFVFFYTTVIWGQGMLHMTVLKFATKLCVKQFFGVQLENLRLANFLHN